jgi:hypothetical protein
MASFSQYFSRGRKFADKDGTRREHTGRRHGLTAYDSVYSELALRRGVPLASFDLALRKAAALHDVILLPSRF